MTGNSILGWQNRIIAILLIAIALALLWLNPRLSQQIDVTANARNSITQTTIDTLRAMDKPLTLTAIIGPARSARKAITKLVDQSRAIKPDIALHFINPEIEPEKARNLDAAPGGELIMQYADREKRLQTLSERSFTQALHELTRSSTAKLAFISGHEERSPEKQTNDDYFYLGQHLKQSGLEALRLSLASVPRIPDNVDVAVIAAPARPYFPGEVASMLDFVNRGGNLLWFIDGDDLSGLDALALELGIALHPGIVIDISSQAFGADSPAFTILDQFPNHPVNNGLDSAVLLPISRALDVTPLAGQVTLPLLQTGDQSWTETSPIEGAIKFDENTDEQQGPLTLAVSFEREKNDRTQRMAVVADADLFASTWIGNGANKEYATRLFNWLANDDHLIQFATPEAPDKVLALSPRQTLLLGAGFLLALPALLLLIAALRWYRGRRE